MQSISNLTKSYLFFLLPCSLVRTTSISYLAYCNSLLSVHFASICAPLYSFLHSSILLIGLLAYTLGPLQSVLKSHQSDLLLGLSSKSAKAEVSTMASKASASPVFLTSSPSFIVFQHVDLDDSDMPSTQGLCAGCFLCLEHYIQMSV